MRVLNGLLALILLAFAAMQYNDPDWAFWGAAYAYGGYWCLLAALAPGVLGRKPVMIPLTATVAAALLGVYHFWPETPGWWHRAVWWETETAREGMGMMVLALALIGPAISAIRAGRARQDLHA